MIKDSNPKQAYGDTKVGLSSVPMGPLYAVATAMAEGGMKYGRHNYRVLGCKHSTYFDAAMGHLVSWFEGEDVDAESGIHHLMKAAASIFVIYDSILMENDTDDRPVRYPGGVPLRINDVIAKLKKKYPKPHAPYIEKDQPQPVPQSDEWRVREWSHEGSKEWVIANGADVDSTDLFLNCVGEEQEYGRSEAFRFPTCELAQEILNDHNIQRQSKPGYEDDAVERSCGKCQHQDCSHTVRPCNDDCIGTRRHKNWEAKQ